MPTPQMKFFFYILLVSFFLILSYSYITNRTRESFHSSFSQEEVNKKEVVVYKEKDVLKLLESLFNQQKRLPQPQTQVQNISSESGNADKKIEDEMKNSKHDYLKKYPDFLNCRKENLPKWTTGSEVLSNPKLAYTNLAPEITYGIDYLRGL